MAAPDPSSSSPPTLEYRRPDGAPPRQWRGLRALLLTVISLMMIGLIVVVAPMFNRPLESPPRVKCASNLKQIGLGMIMYANDHHDQFPDSLQTILADEDITSDVFVCPSSNDTRATGPTTQATLAALGQPGHCSYVYLGKGLTSTEAAKNPNIVLAYEPLANHANTGMNVLFGDAHVEWLASPGVLPWLTGATARPVVRPSRATIVP